MGGEDWGSIDVNEFKLFMKLKAENGYYDNE